MNVKVSRQNATVEQGGKMFEVPDSSRYIPLEIAMKDNEFWDETIRVGNHYQLRIGLKTYLLTLAKEALGKEWKKVYSFSIIVTGPGSNELIYHLGSILDEHHGCSISSSGNIDKKTKTKRTTIHLNQEQVDFFMQY